MQILESKTTVDRTVVRINKTNLKRGYKLVLVILLKKEKKRYGNEETEF